jgi:hypothetical protein
MAKERVVEMSMARANGPRPCPPQRPIRPHPNRTPPSHTSTSLAPADDDAQPCLDNQRGWRVRTVRADVSCAGNVRVASRRWRVMPSAAAAPSAVLLYTKSGIVVVLVCVLVLVPGPGFSFPCCPLRRIFALATCALEVPPQSC